MLISQTEAWTNLKEHSKDFPGAQRHDAETHLRQLLSDAIRCEALRKEAEGIVLDCCRQRAKTETLDLLLELAAKAELKRKMEEMRTGVRIKLAEVREVLHYALRWPQGKDLDDDVLDVVKDAVAEVHGVLDDIERFSREVRSGSTCGAIGERLTDVVVIGIGGSYLGSEFTFEALRTDSACAKAAGGRRLRFLANVDPIDVTRALEGLQPERTLVIVVSKTFTTAETMLNARTLRHWLQQKLGSADVGQHFTAVTASTEKAVAFGVPKERIFPMWDWVGGRYSVTSAVGVLPLSLQYGFANVRQFLDGAHNIDTHFFGAELKDNLPVLLGLFGVWNSSFLGFGVRVLLPYCQALLKFTAHIQQLDMESNGKHVTVLDGQELGFDTGEIDFGEPGTNGQHSFYQLMHQGRVIPADFIGFKQSQQPREVPGAPVANHDELMANFFAQPDALALGKTLAEAEAEAKKEAEKRGLNEAQQKEKLIELARHKVFPGNRPSNVLLLDKLTPYTAGQLLALYEHRTAVQGFLWGINSFDQWGVELGKTMAKNVRDTIANARHTDQPAVNDFNPSTAALLKEYLDRPITRVRQG